MPIIIDLFAGVGGLSLGATRAGLNLRAAIEHDPYALSSHAKNFPNCIHSDSDVSKLSGTDILSLADIQPGQLDGLIGGPPCQGFSSIGLRKAGDERNNLFDHFFRLVQETQPKFFLAENVPGILDAKYDQLRKDSLSKVTNDYVVLKPIRVAANDYGAPTIRTRILFIGYKPEYIRNLTPASFAPDAATAKTTVFEALRGLPTHIDPNWQHEKAGWRVVDRPSQLTPFEQRLSGFVPDGVGDHDALTRYRNHGEVSGCLGTRHCPDVTRRYAALKPKNQDKISKSTRLTLDGFCPTLRAGTGKDKGSFQAVRPIHPTEPRVITPREAARLQGFPDWFVFHKTKWHSFRQIGNSVSPILAEAILLVIRNNFRLIQL